MMGIEWMKISKMMDQFKKYIFFQNGEFVKKSILIWVIGEGIVFVYGYFMLEISKPIVVLLKLKN